MTTPRNDIDRKDFRQLGKPEKLLKARSIVDYYFESDEEFQKQAQTAEEFKEGKHWPADVKAAMESDPVNPRPALVFNLCRAQIRLVMGVAEQNRTEAKAEPTEGSDEFLCEVLNDLGAKVVEMNNMESDQDAAFESMLTCGRGWHSLDVGVDPKNPEFIRFFSQSVDRKEVRRDPNARKDDMSDDVGVVWDKWISREDFKISYPHLENRVNELMDAQYRPASGETVEAPGDIMDLHKQAAPNSGYPARLSTGWYDIPNDRLRICHLEYWESFRRHYGVNPVTGEMEEFEEEILDALKERLGDSFEYQSVIDKRPMWFQFIGDEIVYDDKSPIPFDGFSIFGCFGERETSSGQVTHCGLLKDLIDPQLEVDKRWSQSINLINSQSQGGNFIEHDAIFNLKEYRRTKNHPGADTLLKSGAISGGKIMPKPIPTPPTATIQMEELSQEMMKRIGVNPDLLAMAGERQEPGIVLQLRMKQGLTMLALFFRNYRLFKKQFYERLLSVITKWMPEKQVIAILGNTKKYQFQNGEIINSEKGMRAQFRDLKKLRYNVDIRESNANLTRTMYILAILMELVKAGIPVSPEVIYEYLDVPVTLKTKLKEYFQQVQQIQAQTAQAEMQMKAQESQGRLMLEAKTHSAEMAQKERDSSREYGVKIAELEQENRRIVMELIDTLAVRPQQAGQQAQAA